MSAMKYGWQRLKPVVELSLPQVENILCTFSHKKVRDVQLLGGGLANTNYCCIFNDNSKVLLRIYTRESGSCLVEKTIHDLLQCDLPIAKIVHSDTSQNIIPYSFTIMQWIEGISLREAIIQKPRQLADTFFQLGFLLHHLQKHRFARIGMLDEHFNITAFSEGDDNPFFSYVKECLQSEITQQNIGETLCQEIGIYVDKHHFLYDEIFCNPHLTHGDYNPANILVCPKTYAITAILDWEFAFSGSFYCDMANMLRDEDVYAENCVEQFVFGVQESGIKLHENWREMCKVVDLTSLMGFASTQSCEVRKQDVIHLIKQTVL